MKAIFSTVMLSLVMIGGSSMAYASDFTFEVPIHLTNLHPEITQGNVRCDVLDERHLTIGGSGASAPGFLISGGRYDGVVTVPFNAPQAWRARSYSCELSLTRGGRSGEGGMTETFVFATYGRDPGAAFIVRGDIPAPAAR